MRRILIATLLTATIAACGGSDSSADSADTTDDDLAIQEPGAAAEEVDGEADLEPTAPEGVVDFGEFSQEHVGTNVDYEQTPPVGGPHLPVWQTCDFYDTPVPNERGVHSLEHGAVWITFDPELTADEVSIIESFADGEAEVLASPFEGLPSPVVASAWGVQLQLDSASDPRLGEFVDFYENGPQTPELNTPCAGGVTE